MTSGLKHLYFILGRFLYNCLPCIKCCVGTRVMVR